MVTRRSRSEAGGGTRVPVEQEPQSDDPADHRTAEEERALRDRSRRDAEAFERQQREEAEQRAGEHAFAAAAGDEVVEVTWGEELFQPVQFNSFRVGPFKVTTRVRKGETIPGAIERVHREITAAAAKVHAEKAEAYLKSLAQVMSDVKNTRLP